MKIVIALLLALITAYFVHMLSVIGVINRFSPSYSNLVAIQGMYFFGTIIFGIATLVAIAFCFDKEIK